jgi:anti-sigma factor RsiW
MNCRSFQDDLYEYLDGSLSPGARAAADKHRSECAVCRQRLEQEQQAAGVLFDRFRRATDSLELPPEVGRRVLAALGDEDRRAEAEHGLASLWRGLAWPVALAASVLLLLAGGWVVLRRTGVGDAGPQSHLAKGVISVQFSYVVPTYTFRAEGGFVVDALSYHTNVVNDRRPANPDRLE